jgi:3'-phosphoadenosine 5'-phosphosulfate sulfotransferase (PAPS reductase)/FAD synthetase
MIEHWQLQQRQSLPMEAKVLFSIKRIREYYEKLDGQVYVSFSGGKDSTVLLHLVRQLYPNVTAVFVDTGLEWPEIRAFVKTFDNVVWLRPKMPFNQVIERYGYPVISKDQSRAISRYRGAKDEQTREYRLNGFPRGKKGSISQKWHFLVNAPFKISDECCNRLKKQPLDKYAKESGCSPIMGTLASESNGRTRQYLKTGCNVFAEGKSRSMPLSIWTEKDIQEYISMYKLPLSPIYALGAKRTGCIFCMFGAHRPEDDRFELLAKLHPQLHKYCMETLGVGRVMDYIKKGGSNADND